MKNFKTLALMAFLVTLFSCTNESKPWQIDAKIEIAEVPQAFLYKVKMDRTDSLVDSTSVLDHRFVFNGLNNDDKMGVYAIKFAKGHGTGFIFLVRNGDKVNLEILGESKNKFSGNELQLEYSKYLKVKQKEIDLLKNMMAKFKETNGDPKEIEKIKDWYADATKSINDEKAYVISSIKDGELNGYLVLSEIQISSEMNKDKFEGLVSALSNQGKSTHYGKEAIGIVKYFDAYKVLFDSEIANYQEIKKSYNNLNEENKNSEYGVKVADKILALEKLDYGKEAPALTAKTIDGKDFNLKNIKSKIIIVDFWASWCGPCRLENKNYKNLYSNFKEKGLSIVGYSLDTDKTKWKQAVNDDGLTWVNVSNLKKRKDDSILESYQIGGVPSNLILMDGKVIARNLFGYELEDFLMQNLN